MLITMVAHGTMRLHLTGKGSGMKSIQIHHNINITVMELIPEIAINLKSKFHGVVETFQSAPKISTLWWCLDEKSGDQQSQEGLSHRSARHYVSKLSDTNEKRTESPKYFFCNMFKGRQLWFCHIVNNPHYKACNHHRGKCFCFTVQAPNRRFNSRRAKCANVRRLQLPGLLLVPMDLWWLPTSQPQDH